MHLGEFMAEETFTRAQTQDNYVTEKVDVINAINIKEKYPFIFSSSLILAKTVGLAILYPFKCNIGKTVPSVIGLINLFKCQLVASGPVSASPSPTTQAAIICNKNFILAGTGFISSNKFCCLH